MGRYSHPLPARLLRAPAAPMRRREARAGMAMSLATFSMAAASAIQAVLYLSEFGVTGRTDGFFVAFALYTTFGVFSQSLRLTSVPLLVEPGARLSVREFAAGLGLLAVPVLVATGPLAGPLAQLLAPGLAPEDRVVTETALPVLGAATVLQLWAAGGATVLAIRGRFTTVAASYVAGALAGLLTYLAVMSSAGELTLGWSMLAMAVVTSGWMLAGLRAAGGLGPRTGAFRLRSLVARSGLLLGRTAVYLAFSALFVVTLAYVSHSAPGDATVLSYAYLFASYLVAGTGVALGMSRIPDMTREARAARRAVVAATVPVGFRYAMLLVAPALAALVTAGAPLIHELFPASLDAQGVETLRTFTVLLVSWTVFALLVNLLLPFMFALGRARLVNVLALPLLVVHVAATVVASKVFGVEGTIAVLAVAPALFAVVLVRTGAGPGASGLARELAGDALRFLALAAAAFGAGAAVGELLADGLPATLVAGAVGTVLYCGGVVLVARHQVGVLVGALRPARS